MKVKGSVLRALLEFIIRKFGKNKYGEWLESLKGEAKSIYKSNILTSNWYSLKETLTEPLQVMCNLFYEGNNYGARDFGRFSADYDLKGIYKVFIRIASPKSLINKGSRILKTYYSPSSLNVVIDEKNKVEIKITEFPEMNQLTELKIIGWVERALEICGCRNIKMKIKKSMSKGDEITHIESSWD